MLIVYDEDGVAHEVYNVTEVQQSYDRHQWLENWQIRTRCAPDQKFQGRNGFTTQADIGNGPHGDIVTCIRCLTIPCDHGITFDAATASGFNMSADEVRRRWPRLSGPCPKGCGYNGIYYASFAHYVCGDW